MAAKYMPIERVVFVNSVDGVHSTMAVQFSWSAPSVYAHELTLNELDQLSDIAADAMDRVIAVLAGE
jgi:hypothetical protein